MKVLAFGEIMLRLSPPGHRRLRQAMPGTLDITFAGAEANVCASLAMLGTPSRFFTALPANPIADALLSVLQGLGVDTRGVLRRQAGRLGAYFVETGANQRSSTVVYDRDYSAISLAAAGEYDFDAALSDATWLHISGITPSLSENAYQATLALAKAAHQRGLTVSCDLNFRNKLWRWRAGVGPKQLAQECMSQILPHVDLLFANEEDASDVLGIHAEGASVEQGRIDPGGYERVARSVAARVGNLSRIAITLRESLSASHNNWGALLYDVHSRQAHFAPLDESGQYRPYAIQAIVDRVGSGDAFAAGLIHALTSADVSQPADALRFAVAASCLKHSIPGDFNYTTRDEVMALMAGQASGRVRR